MQNKKKYTFAIVDLLSICHLKNGKIVKMSVVPNAIRNVFIEIGQVDLGQLGTFIIWD